VHLIKKTLPIHTAARLPKVVGNSDIKKKIRGGAGKNNAQETARLTQARKLKEKKHGYFLEMHDLIEQQ